MTNKPKISPIVPFMEDIFWKSDLAIVCQRSCQSKGSMSGTKLFVIEAKCAIKELP